MATTILLIRHAENNWVKERRLAGWTPGVVLNEHGHAQAAALGERLANLPLSTIYSSPLERCLQTAGYVAGPHQLEVLPLLAVGEVRYGEWEGAALKDLYKKPEWRGVQFAPSRFQFPGGEALRDVQARAVTALEDLARQHPRQMIAVVSHGDVIKLALAHFMGMHLDLFQRLGLGTASVSVLRLGAQGVSVVRVNDDGPLQAPPPEKEEEGDEQAAEESETKPADTGRGAHQTV